jgi:hypothetical protein
MQRKNETLLEDNWLGIKKDDPHTKIFLLGMVPTRRGMSATETLRNLPMPSSTMPAR